VRKDRISPGGGVLIYFKEDLTIYPAYTWDRSDLEATWLNVITMRSQLFLVGCIYKPPDDPSFFQPFRELSSRAHVQLRRKNIILLGNFNPELLPKSDNSESDYENTSKQY